MKETDDFTSGVTVMPNRMSIEECYRVLELEPGCSATDLKGAWRLLSQIWHPDKHEAGSQAYKLAVKRQQSLNEAYSILTEFLARQQGTRAEQHASSKPHSANQSSSAYQSSSNQSSYGQQSSAGPNSQSSANRGRQQEHYSDARASAEETARRRSSLDQVRSMARSFTKAPESMSSTELAEWARKAKNGELEGQFFVGLACEFGLGGNKVDYDNAAFWYERAASKGHAASLHRLGYLFLYGHGVKQNSSKGIGLWKDAAQRGYAEAQMDLGMAFENGAWVQSNLAEAKRWYAMAAEKGDPVARHKLAEK